MKIKPFLEQLQHDLHHSLPGEEAQYRMAPRPRAGGRLPYDQSPENARHSGVLILFYPRANAHGMIDIHLPLILRPTYEGVHSGQVAFPGGSREEVDSDIVATALREAEEEIGVERQQIQILGQLSPLYIYVSNHLVHPTVAWIDHRPRFQPDPSEVAQILETPLRELHNPANLRLEEWQLRDRTAEVPFYYIHRQSIWGATAMMLSELLALPSVAQNSTPSD